MKKQKKTFDFSRSESVLWVVTFCCVQLCTADWNYSFCYCCAAVRLETAVVRVSSAEQLFKITGKKVTESYKLLRAAFTVSHPMHCPWKPARWWVRRCRVLQRFFSFYCYKVRILFRNFSPWTYGKFHSSKLSFYPNLGHLRIVFAKPSQMTQGIIFSPKQLF